MLQQLPQIDRISSSLSQLQKQKEMMKQMMSKTKLVDRRIQKQVSNTIDEKIYRAKQKLALCEKLEKEIENEEFINGQFLVEDLVYDVTQLPQWFSFVFQKEFDKQRSYFSGIAKRLYKHHCLYEKKNQLAYEIKSFDNLHNRYQSLNKTEQECININSEAQTFQNRCAMLVDRFINFIELIGSKIMHFVEENAQKSLNYSNQISNYTHKSQNFGSFPQNNNNPTITAFEIPKERVEFSLIDKTNNRYISTMPTHADMSMGRGKWQGGCLNHKIYSGLSGPERHMVGFNESKYNEGSRFNYKEYMPKWMNRTLASFYS